jgi:hypothetical protein
MAADRRSPDDKIKLHIVPIGQGDFDEPLTLTDHESRLNDWALLRTAPCILDVAPMRDRRFAVQFLFPSKGNGKSDPGLPVALETLHVSGMQGGCSRAGVDLRAHGGDAQSRQAHIFAPADLAGTSG